jgi:hypothetical protein
VELAQKKGATGRGADSSEEEREARLPPPPLRSLPSAELRARRRALRHSRDRSAATPPDALAARWEWPRPNRAAAAPGRHAESSRTGARGE